MKFHSKQPVKRKPSVDQDKMAWLQMELQVMREANEALRNSK